MQNVGRKKRSGAPLEPANGNSGGHSVEAPGLNVAGSGENDPGRKPAARGKVAGREPLTAVSLFSGCGGLDLGLIEAGFDIVVANDVNRHAADTYRDNIGGTSCAVISATLR